MGVVGHQTQVGTLPVDGNPDETKQTNEIKMAIPLLDASDIQGKNITADALLTQREFAAIWSRIERPLPLHRQSQPEGIAPRPRPLFPKPAETGLR